MPDVDRVTIVTDATMTRLGLRRQDHRRAGPPAANRSRCRSSTTSSPSRPSTTVQRGAELMRDVPAGHDHRARRRLADGRRQGDVAAVRAPGGRLRRPAGRSSSTSASAPSRFPTLGDLAQLVCIPTTSGTGAEVTPFAVITDPDDRQEVPARRLRADPDASRSSTRC